MPRIRKKTSNRQNTRDRAKIKRKVSEHNKKQKRDTKRNVQWKSKKKADPGIPNSFHLKDQVLADLAKEKRLAEEAKLARREALKQKSKADAGQEEEDDTPGIVSVQSKVRTATSALPVAGSSKQTLEEEVPDLIDRSLSTLQEVLDRADVILEVVDARDIQGGRSGYIEGMIEEANGKLLVVVNKADLVPRETLATWLSHLPPTTLLFSSTPLPASSSTSPILPGLDELKSGLLALSKSSKSDEPLIAALMGLPSVGKTSILNALLSPSQSKHAVTPSVLTAANAKHPDPTTKAPVEVKITLDGGEVVHVIDTPGWEYAEDEDELDDEDMDEAVAGDEEAQGKKWDKLEAQVAGDLLRRNLGRIDRVKNAMAPVAYIVSRSNAEDLMTCYNLPYFQEGNLEAFLIALARANGRLKKGGEPDIDAAARIVLRDWSLNQFPYYATPPKGDGTSAEPVQAERDAVKGVLELLRTRKEMRSTGRGLVRFRGGEIDSREIILDDDYLATAGPSDDEEEPSEDDEEEEDLDLGEDDEDEEGGDDDEDDEEGSLDSETERFLMDAANGEEVDLEDGSEPDSGSDVPEGSAESDEEEDEEDEEAPPVVGTKRKAVRSPIAKKEPSKRKRVSFGANVKFNEKPVPKAPKAGKLALGGKRKREEAEKPAPAKREKQKGAKAVRALPSKAAAPKGKLANGTGAGKEKPKPKAAVFQSSAKVNGNEAQGGEEAYDFSKHF